MGSLFFDAKHAGVLGFFIGFERTYHHADLRCILR